MVVYNNNNNNRQNIIDKRKGLPSCSECFNVFVRHLGTFVNASHNWYTVRMVADLCRVVLSCFRCEKAKRRQAKTRQMVTFSCFRMATFRPVTRKYNTFHASPFRLLFVVYLPGGAKGRHAKTRQMVTFSCFRMATFRPATRKYATFHALRFRLLFVVSLSGEAKGRHAKTRQNHLFAWRPIAFLPRKHVYTTWHKSATIQSITKKLVTHYNELLKWGNKTITSTRFKSLNTNVDLKIF